MENFFTELEPQPEKVLYYCANVAKLNQMQVVLIERHLPAHMWYHGITDEAEGIYSFLKMYAWAFRDTFCLTACEYRKYCALVK